MLSCYLINAATDLTLWKAVWKCLLDRVDHCNNLIFCNNFASVYVCMYVRTSSAKWPLYWHDPNGGSNVLNDEEVFNDLHVMTDAAVPFLVIRRLLWNDSWLLSQCVKPTNWINTGEALDFDQTWNIHSSSVYFGHVLVLLSVRTDQSRPRNVRMTLCSHPSNSTHTITTTM